MNGQFDSEGKLGPDKSTVFVKGPIEFDTKARVDLLVTVVFETGEVAVGTVTDVTPDVDGKWSAWLQARKGEELRPGPAIGWAAASIVTNEKNGNSGYSWRISTYSWDVPITITPF